MKPEIKKWVKFIGKSMLWSLSLYMLIMLAFNWDDVSNAVKGNSEVTIVNTLPPGNTSISVRINVTRSIIVILKTISGITTRSTTY